VRNSRITQDSNPDEKIPQGTACELRLKGGGLSQMGETARGCLIKSDRITKKPRSAALIHLGLSSAAGLLKKAPRLLYRPGNLMSKTNDRCISQKKLWPRF